MKDNNFRNEIEVSKEDLIPIDPLEKCLWVMNVTGKIAHFGLITRRNIEEEQTYGNHYWVINHELGDLEYKLRKGKIDKKHFEDSCNQIYDRYDLNFDILRDNLSALEDLEQESTPEKESSLSTKLNKQAESYFNKLEKKRLMEQDNSQLHGDNFKDSR